MTGLLHDVRQTKRVAVLNSVDLKGATANGLFQREVIFRCEACSGCPDVSYPGLALWIQFLWLDFVGSEGPGEHSVLSPPSHQCRDNLSLFLNKFGRNWIENTGTPWSV